MGETQLESASVLNDTIRSIFSFFDRIAYGLLQGMYQLFFNVTTVDLFSNSTITKFYSRVQLIIGVFMLFHLAMTILKGIVNPDTFTDSKSGAGNLITRIALSLVLLTVLVPINISSPKNEYEKQLNRNGLLFGTLYSLQYRLLSNNTIGRLILGTDATSSNYTSLDSDDDEEKIKTASRVFASTVLKGFYRINLLPEDERPKHEEGKDDAIFNDNRVCQDIDDAYLDAYTRLDAEPSDIIGMVTVTCEPDTENYGTLQKALSLLSPKLAGTSRYAFAYNGFISMIVAFVFAFILLSFSVDVAVRAVKLAILRLIAPIPIISYMDPKGSKDGAFNSWVKTLASTYLDLFIRLGTVYFVIYLIQDMIVHGIVIKHGSGILGIITLIIVWIGLFVFAKQAPKFIKDVLGIKGETGKLFGGFGEILGVGAVAGGILGSAATNWRASSEENKQLHSGQNVRNMFRNVGSAITGAIGGGYAGAKAFMGKDASAKSIMAAQNQRNALRASHSTMLGRMRSDMYGMVAGRSLATRDQEQFDTASKAFDALKKYKTTAEEEALKQKNYYGVYNGNSFNFEKLSSALARARGAGATTFDYDDGVHSYTGLSTDEFDTNTMNDIKSDQTARYVSDQQNGVGPRNGTLMNQWESTRRAVHNAGFDVAGSFTNPETGVTTNYAAFTDGSYSGTKAAMGRAKDVSTRNDTNMRTIMNRANSQGKK